MKTILNFIFIHPPLLLLLLLLGVATPGLAGCYQYPPLPAAPPPDPNADPPAVSLGQRLFRDGRFSQYFFVNSGGDPNAVLGTGDSVLDTTQTRALPLPGPYAGSGINCAACHLVDEQLDALGGGMRAYADFARRTPIPDRGDGRQVTVRNVPSMVDALAPRAGATFLHFDGQFASATGLVRGTLIGRNFGWQPEQSATAVAHIAGIIRGDDGSGVDAANYGRVPYRAVFNGASWLPPDRIIPEALRLDVSKASDDQILDGVANLIAAYMASLKFSRDAAGDFDGSPYDLFLRFNGLPLRPDPGEAPLQYARRLRGLLAALPSPRLVTVDDGEYKYHAHPFQFGAAELAGLMLFLQEAPPNGASAGNCISCHAPPDFSDFGFHNTGVAQASFDAVWGPGAFGALPVPSLTERNAEAAQFLPPSPAAPRAIGVFSDIPDVSRPGHADLGLWNVLGNPALPDPQPDLLGRLCAQLDLAADACSDDAVLPLTIALFKTPGLRDLGHSAPYMHDGASDTIEDAIQHYVTFGRLARAGQVRNGDPALAAVQLGAADVAALAAFLRALDEDYH